MEIPPATGQESPKHGVPNDSGSVSAAHAQAESLVHELRALRAQLLDVQAERAQLRQQLHSRTAEAEALKERCEAAEARLATAKNAATQQAKIHARQLKRLEAAVRRSDSTVPGDSATLAEQKRLRTQNWMLIRFIEQLGTRYHFDTEVVRELVEAGADTALNAFIENSPAPPSNTASSVNTNDATPNVQKSC